ncbi:MAG TPA: M23 family metallopeptidase [Gammaproteobacteria bacterium]|nr:M23 family metallopeptidase [Gammaproteobacteria bacterium]
MKGFAFPGRFAAVCCTMLLWAASLLAAVPARADHCLAPRVCRPLPGAAAPSAALAPLVAEGDAAGVPVALGALSPYAGGSRASLGVAIRPPGLRPLPWSSSMDRHEVVVGVVDADHDDTYEYRLPYGDELSWPVTQGYGAKLSHRGPEQFTVDFGMPPGTPVHAAREGVVVLAEDSHVTGCWSDECARLANFVVVLHADGTTGEYFHLQHGSVQVRVGDRVQRGQRLALSGNTGYSSAPHLHFGVYRTGRDGTTQSVAVRFRTREGVIGEPRAGARYLNVDEANAAETAHAHAALESTPALRGNTERGRGAR